jgi:hypothetical protein
VQAVGSDELALQVDQIENLQRCGDCDTSTFEATQDGY